MKEISIRELHAHTGSWVRTAGDWDRIVVKDRGRPVATLSPFKRAPRRTPFNKRQLVPGFADLPRIPGDCMKSISEDRDRRASSKTL